MADTSLIFNALGKDKVSKMLGLVRKSFVATGTAAAQASDKATGAAAKLDSKIGEVEGSIKALSREFAATNDQELFRKIAKERTLLRNLKRIREELDDVGDEAAEAGRKIGKAFAGKIGGRVGAVLPGALSGVFSALPPQVQGVVAVAGAAIGLALGTAVGAAVVAGILLFIGGGALVAGIVAAARDPAVAKAWGAFGKSAKSSLAGFIEPFKGPMIRAATTFGDALKRMGPTLARIGQAVAPLIDDLAPALAAMAEKALPGIEKAVNASLPLFRVLAEHAPTIGEAVSKFLAKVSAGAPGATLFLDHLLSTVEFLLPAFGTFFAMLAAKYRMSVAMFVALGQGILTVVNVILAGFKTVADVAALIPGPHQAAMRKVSDAIGKGIDKVNGLSQALDDLKRPRSTTVSVKTANAMEKLRKLDKKIAAVVYDRTMGITVAVRGGGRIPERAHGGPVTAGQPYVVGERRPELFVPDTDGHIEPRVTRGSGGGAAGGGVVTVRLVVDGADKDMLRMLRKMVRVEGAGNVQVAFGR